MKAPLIPVARLREWTIVHESGDVIPGFGGCVAFTTRAAFDAWARGDIIIRREDWRYGDIERILHIEVALLTPSQYVLILEEAWWWKFPGECPQMSSAADGQEVLGELLGGDFSPAQKAFYEMTRAKYATLNRPSSETMFISAWQERAEWQEYRRLEHWKPDAVVGPGGNVLLLRGVDCEDVTLVSKGGSFGAVIVCGRLIIILSPLEEDEPLLREGDELMIVEDTPNDDHLWSPERTSRQSPAYLGTLT